MRCIRRIEISNQLSHKIPNLSLGVQLFKVSIEPIGVKSLELQQKIINRISHEFDLDTIKNRASIKSTRDGYKSAGKDPNRYRPSADALTRRIVSGKSIYRINNIVDMINMLSIETGISIGGYCDDEIIGNIVADLGDTSPYDAIARGALNIENLPALKDDLGFFGSPTSDSQRTMIRDNTNYLLQVAFIFSPELNDIERFLTLSEHWHYEYNNAELLDQKIVQKE